MKALNKLNYKNMFKEKPVETEEVVEVVAEPAKSVACENCEDSGKECYVCGAGRPVAK